MNSSEVLDVFRKTNALLDGHFILRSGRHSRQFFQCAKALQQMPTVEKLGRALMEKVLPAQPDTVLAPAMGGLVIGQEVARQFGCRFIFLEKVDGVLELRRGFSMEEGEKVLIVEDVVTRGGRVTETINIARHHQADILGAAILVDRSNGEVDPGIPIFSLIRMKVETFSPDNLPEDLKAIPTMKPGSS
jgi:orotate phosphoribosyltransferase